MVGEGPVTAGPAGSQSSRLWGVTSYFNPMRYRRRLANFRAFRARLDVPLVAVELAYGPDFELTEGDADVLIRLRGRDVMWQKERLLNVALEALPGDCRKVAWLDCDVLFESSDWADRLDRLLDRHPLVQAFSRVAHLSPRWKPDDGATAAQFTQSGVLALVAEVGVDALASRIPTGPGSSSKGLAWAARRELLAEHRLYDACIVGGGDMALAAAVLGRFDVATRTMNGRQAEHYLRWAAPWHDTVSGHVGALDATVFHLWHGDVGNRRYRERHDGLAPHTFDPAVDIALDDTGAWRWSSDKPAMHEYVRTYFASRREDGESTGADTVTDVTDVTDSSNGR
jgi:hypothetical protein